VDELSMAGNGVMGAWGVSQFVREKRYGDAIPFGLIAAANLWDLWHFLKDSPSQ